MSKRNKAPTKKKGGASVRRTATSAPTASGFTQQTQAAIVVQGRIYAFHLTVDGLVIKLKVDSRTQLAFLIGADDPMFRGATSIALMALNERQNPPENVQNPTATVWVEYANIEKAQSSSQNKLIRATGIGVGVDEPFEIDDWVWGAPPLT